MDPVADGVASITMTANNLFLPFVGATVQPAGFDQWLQFYKHWNVIASNVKWELLPATSTDFETSSVHLEVLAYSDDLLNSAPTNLNWHNKAANPNTVKRIISTKHAGGNNGVCVIRQNFKMKRDFGHGITGKTEGGNVGGPDEEWQYHLSVHNPWEDDVDPSHVHGTVTVVYTVKFSDRLTTIYDT